MPARRFGTRRPSRVANAKHGVNQVESLEFRAGRTHSRGLGRGLGRGLVGLGLEVAELELAPDGRPRRGIGLGVAAQALGSVLLDDGASFVEEAVRGGQGQREDGSRELAHGCFNLLVPVHSFSTQSISPLDAFLLSRGLSRAQRS